MDQINEGWWTIESKWLFPSPKAGKHITGPSIDHAVRNNQADFGVDHFTPHDLRRTGASMMASLSVPRLTVSKILNHRGGPVLLDSFAAKLSYRLIDVTPLSYCCQGHAPDKFWLYCKPRPVFVH